MADDLYDDQQRDEYRHKRRIYDKLRSGIDDILKRRDIISADPKKRVRVPVEIDEDPHISVVPKNPDGGSVGGDGAAGDEGREPDYFVEMPLDEVADMVFGDLRLPVIRPRRSQRDEEEEYRLDARQPKGPPPRLDRKKSMLDHLKREILTGDGAWHDEDLKYRVFSRKMRPGFEAAVAFVRDASGSMGEEETTTVYIAAWWTAMWLRRNYPRVDIHWLIHGTEAMEVTEQQFFTLGNMGGTLISSGVRLGREILERQHKDANWYMLVYSDGDNWPQDMPTLVSEAKGLAERCDLFGYADIGGAPRSWRPAGESDTYSALKTVGGATRLFSPLQKNNIGMYLRTMFGGGERDAR